MSTKERIMLNAYYTKGRLALSKWVWLITISFPIFLFTNYHTNLSIKPEVTTISVRVNGDSNDAEEQADNSVDINSSDLELGEDGSADQICGIRFQDINIPPGSVINSAYIEFYADGNHSDALNVDIYGEDTASAITFVETSSNLSNRNKTIAKVDWDNIGNWTDNQLYQTPDISTIIREIVNRSDWAVLNDLVIFIEMDGSTGTRRAESYDGNSSVAPLIVIDYTASPNCLLTNIAATTTCNNNNTNSTLDDYYTITVQPTGYNLSTAYNVSGNYGGTNFNATNLAYGSAQTLSIQVPIGTPTNLTITDVDSTTCSLTRIITSPPECSSIFTCWAIADEGNPDILFRYDSDVNTWTSIGSTTVNGIEALAYNPATDEIYTADRDLVGKVSLTTGAFVALGTAIGTLSGANGGHNIGDIDGLSLDPFTGILWATERRSGGTNNDYLFQIDTATGGAIPDAFGTGIDYVEVAEVYDPINGQNVYDVDDIAVDPANGDLYAINNQGGTGGVLTIVNKTDGTTKQIIGNFADIDDMEAIGFYNSGFLYGSTGNNSPDEADKNRFFLIDKTDASLVEQAKIDPTDTERDFEACDCLTGGVNTIAGTVYHDENGNTLLTSGELGLGGVRVYLYRDVDVDSVFTEGVDVLLDSIVTAADGTYTFTFAATGNFLMTINTTDLPSQTILTTDNSESAFFSGTGEHNVGNDFGYIAEKYDFGDLPDIGQGTTGINDYETYDSTGGPSHLIVEGLFLGDTVDVDTDGQPNENALGDDANGVDDEDGISFLPSLNILPGGTIRLPLKVNNTTGDTAHLEAWIDWNGDGDFDTVNELVTDYQDNKDGLFPAYMEIAVPANALKGAMLGFRVRLSITNNMTPYGKINSGEVEDYLIGVDCPQMVCLTPSIVLERG